MRKPVAITMMDVNATLARIRAIRKTLTVSDADTALPLYAELADLITVLDGYLSIGGYLPTVWERTQNYRREYRQVAEIADTALTV